MKVYIAAPFFNPEQLAQVIAVENLLKEREVEFFSPRSFGVIKDMTPEEKEREMKNIYNMNVEKLLWCDVAIVLVDHKDTGTTWELGFLSGVNNQSKGDFQETKIITVSLEKKPVNVMLRYCINAHAETLINLEQIICTLIDGRDISNYQNNLEVDE
jgi:nucleoside 2-deoxyribosyltransferase